MKTQTTETPSTAERDPPRKVGVLCSPACGFVAVTPTVVVGGKPVEGHCPKCARVIPLS